MKQNPESLYELDGCTNTPRAVVAPTLRPVHCASATLPRTFSHLALSVLVSWLIAVAALGATYNERPWWAERAAFVEGDTLFAVGVASRAKTVEEGRQQAFERGLVELTNYAQITSLEAQGLVIETQMTFEEPNADGTVNVYRLLRVPIAKLLSVQSQLQSRSEAKGRELDQARRDLAAKQQALYQKELEAKELLQRLKSQLAEQQTKPSQNDSETPVLERLKQATVRVEKQTEDAETVIRSAQQRIARGNEERKTLCSRLLKGMTKAEVATVLGEPTGRKTPNLLVYGREKRITIDFDEDTQEARFIYGCERDELADSVQLHKAIEDWFGSPAHKEYLQQKAKTEESRTKRKAERAKREQEKEDGAVRFVDCALAQMGKPEAQREDCPEP